MKNRRCRAGSSISTPFYTWSGGLRAETYSFLGHMEVPRSPKKSLLHANIEIMRMKEKNRIKIYKQFLAF